MRKLKMLTGLCGSLFSLAPGDEHEFEDDEAMRLVRAGFAEATDEATGLEIAEEIAQIEAAEASPPKAPAPTPEPASAPAPAASGAAATGQSDLGAARKAYRAVFGKGPGPSWSIEQIAAKIAEKAAQA